MVGFILGLSLMINVVFIGLLVYGWRIEKKNIRQIKKIIRNAQLRPDLFKDWMYEA